MAVNLVLLLTRKHVATTKGDIPVVIDCSGKIEAITVLENSLGIHDCILEILIPIRAID